MILRIGATRAFARKKPGVAQLRLTLRSRAHEIDVRVEAAAWIADVGGARVERDKNRAKAERV